MRFGVDFRASKFTPMPPIYVAKNGQQLGPFTLEELDQMLQSESINGQDLYWHKGQSGWLPIAQLPGYVPPPAPASNPLSQYLPKSTPSPMPAAPSPAPAPAPLLPSPGSLAPSGLSSRLSRDPARTKAEYVKRIRSNSVYPTFRSLVGTIVLLFYVLGTICIIAGLAAAVTQMGKAGSNIIEAAGAAVIGLITGLIYIVIGKVLKEASLMLADIADTLLDQHSRQQ